MPAQFTVVDTEGLHNFEVIPGLEKASSELIQMVMWVKRRHPDLTDSHAGFVTAYFLHHLPQIIEANPELIAVIDNTAKYISKSELD